MKRRVPIIGGDVGVDKRLVEVLKYRKKGGLLGYRMSVDSMSSTERLMRCTVRYSHLIRYSQQKKDRGVTVKI